MEATIMENTQELTAECPVPTPETDHRHCQEILEAILFAAGHPLTYDKIGEVLGVTNETAAEIVREYAALYNRRDGDVPRGIMLLLFPDSCQLCTREEYGQYVREALGIRRGGNLSQSSIETLAIIAYNEPVTRAYVETVRGVDSSYTMISLTEKHLIEPCGRLDVPGRPLLYRTTPDFLRVFGLSSRSELPDLSAEALSKAEDESAEELLRRAGVSVPEEAESEAAADGEPPVETEAVLSEPAQQARSDSDGSPEAESLL